MASEPIANTAASSADAVFILELRPDYWYDHRTRWPAFFLSQLSLIVVELGCAGLAGEIAVVVAGRNMDVVGKFQAHDLAEAWDKPLSHRAASSASICLLRVERVVRPLNQMTIMCGPKVSISLKFTTPSDVFTRGFRRKA